MIKLGEPLILGGWCQIFSIQDHPNLCAKVLIPKRRFKGSRPDPNEIVNIKYGISDFIEYEWNNYKKITSVCPEELRKYLVTIHGIDWTVDGRKALVMETVLDDQGITAKNLVHNKRSLDDTFFRILEQLRKELFVANSIDHFGIVRRNILVKSSGHPVLIDFQTGRERFRGQFWLQIPWFVRKKINRCFKKLYSEMEVPSGFTF